MEKYPNNQSYEILEVLGENMGSTLKVRHKESNNIYVMKKIFIKNIDENKIKAIQNEAEILSTINNEFIVKYIDSFKDNNYFYIIMEYCENSDLRNFINNHKKKNQLIGQDVILFMLLDICTGLKEIHNKNIIHRDLKPDNIFISKDFKIKIGDFGISKILNDYAKTKKGTKEYSAPEMIKENSKYSNKVDIWSLGCIIYELCTLKMCFGEDDSESLEGLLRLYKKIEKGEHGEINLQFYKPELQKLIDSLLKVDYKTRPDINEIYDLVLKYNKKFIIENKNIDSSDIISFNIIKRKKNVFNIIENKKDYDFENNSEEEKELIIQYSGNYGGIDQDSKFWDDFEEKGEDILLKSKIIKIKIFLGKYNEKICINGIGYSFKNKVTGEITSYEHIGSDKYIEFKELMIKNNEYLTDFHIRYPHDAEFITQLGFTTNKNNNILVGSEEGEEHFVRSNGKGNIIVGTFGCMNKKLDSMGVLFIPKNDYFFRISLFPYFLLRYLYQKDYNFKEKWNKKNKELPIIYQYLWNVIKLENKLFRLIIKYIDL